ncbi:MAG: hypothetical protein AAF195_01100 [Pseudomonadota bacterium]
MVSTGFFNMYAGPYRSQYSNSNKIPIVIVGKGPAGIEALYNLADKFSQNSELQQSYQISHIAAGEPIAWNGKISPSPLVAHQNPTEVIGDTTSVDVYERIERSKLGEHYDQKYQNAVARLSSLGASYQFIKGTVTNISEHETNVRVKSQNNNKPDLLQVTYTNSATKSQESIVTPALLFATGTSLPESEKPTEPILPNYFDTMYRYDNEKRINQFDQLVKQIRAKIGTASYTGWGRALTRHMLGTEKPLQPDEKIKLTILGNGPSTLDVLFYLNTKLYEAELNKLKIQVVSKQKESAPSHTKKMGHNYQPILSDEQKQTLRNGDITSLKSLIQEWEKDATSKGYSEGEAKNGILNSKTLRTAIKLLPETEQEKCKDAKFANDIYGPSFRTEASRSSGAAQELYNKEVCSHLEGHADLQSISVNKTTGKITYNIEATQTAKEAKNECDILVNCTGGVFEKAMLAFRKIAGDDESKISAILKNKAFYPAGAIGFTLSMNPNYLELLKEKIFPEPVLINARVEGLQQQLPEIVRLICKQLVKHRHVYAAEMNPANSTSIAA